MPPLWASLSPVASPRSPEVRLAFKWNLGQTQVVQGQFVQFHVNLVKSWAGWVELQTNLGWIWSEPRMNFWAGMRQSQAKFQINPSWFLSLQSIMGILFSVPFLSASFLILLLFWILILRATPCLQIAMRARALLPLLLCLWRK